MTWSEYRPQLAAVLYTRGINDPDRGHIESEISNAGVLCLEMYLRPEGAVAIEDPRHRSLRLVPDHGVYFEFVPVDQLGRPRPSRLSAAQVKLGVPYALALSSPAGIWACLVGSVVCFERRDPPLLRLVETSASWERPAPSLLSPAQIVTTLHPLPAHSPHRRNGGTAATHPERPFHSVSSAHAGRE